MAVAESAELKAARNQVDVEFAVEAQKSTGTSIRDLTGGRFIAPKETSSPYRSSGLS